MADKRRISPEIFNNPVMHLPEQFTESDLRELLDTLERLQLVLYRLIFILSSGESIASIRLVQSTLKTIGNEINDLFLSGDRMRERNQVENWDNEGGHIEYASI